MKFAGIFLVIFAAAAAPVRIAWNAAPDPNAQGYFVYTWKPETELNRSNRVDAGESTTATVDLTPGPWLATVSSYNTNNPNAAHLESEFCPSILFFVPGSPDGISLPDARPYVPPIVTLSTNAAAVVTVWLDTSRDLSTWTNALPAVRFEVNDGTAAAYRARLTISTP